MKSRRVYGSTWLLAPIRARETVCSGYTLLYRADSPFIVHYRAPPYFVITVASRVRPSELATVALDDAAAPAARAESRSDRADTGGVYGKLSLSNFCELFFE